MSVFREEVPPSEHPQVLARAKQLLALPSRNIDRGGKKCAALAWNLTGSQLASCGSDAGTIRIHYFSPTGDFLTAAVGLTALSHEAAAAAAAAATSTAASSTSTTSSSSSSSASPISPSSSAASSTSATSSVGAKPGISAPSAAPAPVPASGSPLGSASAILASAAHAAAASGASCSQLAGHTQAVQHLKWSPTDAHVLASAGLDGVVRLWDDRISASRASYTLELRTPLVGLEWYRSGTSGVLLTVDRAGAVKYFDIRRRQPVFQAECRGARAVAVAPREERVLIGSAAGNIDVYPVRFQFREFSAPAHIGGVSHLTVAPNGGMLVSAGDDSSVTLWDPQSFTALSTCQAHSTAVTAVGFSHDSALLASTSRESLVHITDTATGDYVAGLAPLPTSGGPLVSHPTVTALAWHPQAYALAVAVEEPGDPFAEPAVKETHSIRVLAHGRDLCGSGSAGGGMGSASTGGSWAR